MFNMLAWLLFGSPLIITSARMIRSAAKQRAGANLLRPQSPRVEMPWNRNVDTTRSGFDERYFSNNRNRDRASTFR
jgi:hypothetical protein